jgi:hypothetical protein
MLQQQQHADAGVLLQQLLNKQQGSGDAAVLQQLLGEQQLLGPPQQQLPAPGPPMQQQQPAGMLAAEPDLSFLGRLNSLGAPGCCMFALAQMQHGMTCSVMP